jgi:hypothetical protein
MITNAPWAVRFVHGLRTLAARAELRNFRRLHALLRDSSELRAFHEGRSNTLPEFYHRQFEQRLGRYAELLPRVMRRPILDAPAFPRARGTALEAQPWALRGPSLREHASKQTKQKRTDVTNSADADLRPLEIHAR